MTTETRDANVPEETDEELRARIGRLSYRVTQEAGTEAPWTGLLLDEKREGTFNCIVCGNELFSSDTKYESGSGWPSFWGAVDDDKVTTRRDTSHWMVRTEILCGRCGAHLGHLFDDGPGPSGERYCTNSAALTFQPR